MELGQADTSSRRKMSSPRKRFIILIVALVSLGAVVALVLLARGETQFLYHARFTEFSVCAGPDPDTVLPQTPLTSLPSTTETVFACGHLEAGGSVPLHFLLFYEGKPTNWFDRQENYRAGYIFKELPQPGQKPGTYRVEVWLNRQELASTTFAIVP
jgi:hypothetical protein